MPCRTGPFYVVRIFTFENHVINTVFVDELLIFNQIDVRQYLDACGFYELAQTLENLIIVRYFYEIWLTNKLQFQALIVVAPTHIKHF